LLYDGTILEGPDWTIEVLHTPGHCSNHICFVLREEEALLTGDHVMGWSTTVVAPPDGDMAAYINALERLRMRAAQGIDKVFWPGHGGPVCEPEPYLTSLIAHRHAREAQILDVLAAGPSLIGPIVSRIYANVDLGLHSAAASSTYAHLICLAANGLIVAEGGETRFDALYRLR
jgi:glyoxylase-like metal-dependent hydrolase (beta-lactamase superfamily II)